MNAGILYRLKANHDKSLHTRIDFPSSYNTPSSSCHFIQFTASCASSFVIFVKDTKINVLLESVLSFGVNQQLYVGMYDPDNLHSNLLSANWFLKAVLKYKLGNTTYFVQHAWYAVQFTNIQSTIQTIRTFLAPIDFWRLKWKWHTTAHFTRLTRSTAFYIHSPSPLSKIYNRIFGDLHGMKWKLCEKILSKSKVVSHFTRLTHKAAFYSHPLPPKQRWTSSSRKYTKQLVFVKVRKYVNYTAWILLNLEMFLW